MHAVLHALSIAGSMTWEITWALILGFALSAIVQAVVHKSTIVRALGDDRPRTLTLAAGLGTASSSCSYAAVALARSLYRKGADFTAAMAFEIASTNFVIELGVILALLMGWEFTAAEFVGGPIMIAVLAVLFRLLLRDRLLRQARDQAERCRCQEPRPCWSRCMLVFVQDAAEAVASADVEVGEPVGFGDGFGQLAEGRGAGEVAVGPVRVVELLVLA
jgi:uncharacterized membrane protein YraQ (UPF0718 family)